MAEKSSGESKSIASGHPMEPGGRDKIVHEANREGTREGAKVQRDQGVDPNTLPPNQNARGD